MENKLQTLKFRVYSEAHSKAIQDKLFEIGYDFEPHLFDKHYLFIDYKSSLTWTHVEQEFINEHQYTLCTLDDLYKMKSEPNPQIELMTKLERIQKELDSVKEEISKLNK